MYCNAAHLTFTSLTFCRRRRKVARCICHRDPAAAPNNGEEMDAISSLSKLVPDRLLYDCLNVAWCQLDRRHIGNSGEVESGLTKVAFESACCPTTAANWSIHNAVSTCGKLDFWPGTAAGCAATRSRHNASPRADSQDACEDIAAETYSAAACHGLRLTGVRWVDQAVAAVTTWNVYCWKSG